MNYELPTDIPVGEGDKAERTEWHRVVAFGKLAEICGQHLAKGRTVYVEGRLQTRAWEKDGDKRSVTEIVAGSVQFLGGNGKGASAPANEPPPVKDDEIPFQHRRSGPPGGPTLGGPLHGLGRPVLEKAPPCCAPLPFPWSLLLSVADGP